MFLGDRGGPPSGGCLAASRGGVGLPQVGAMFLLTLMVSAHGLDHRVKKG